MRRPGPLIAALALVLVATGCAGSDGEPGPDATTPDTPSHSQSSSGVPTGTPPPEAEPTETGPTETGPTEAERVGPVIRRVPRPQWQRMVAAGMVRPECPIQRRGQLRRVDLDYVDFRGRTQRGHLIVNRDVAESVARIFEALYQRGFPIARMTGVEKYDGDVNRSLRANNTSAFNCRRANQINAPFKASPHANGRAVDINPVQNPWIDLRCECWIPGPENRERTEGPGKILKGGPVWQLFTAEGWIWQNIDTPDYMHFDTGYPSAPYRGPES